MAYTSYLKRAIKALNNVIDAMNADWIPVQKSWRLNEKHYGMLQGLNKSETAAKYGENKCWFGVVASTSPPIPSPKTTRNATRSTKIATLKWLTPELPRTESLKDCIGRTLPYWTAVIFPPQSRRPPRGGTR